PDSVVNALSLLKESLFRAEFTESGLEAARRRALYERRYSEGAQGWRLAARLLNAYADEQMLGKVSLREIRAYYRTHYRPERTCLVLAGNFTTEQLVAFAQQFFGHEWEAASASKRQVHEMRTPLRLGAAADPRGLLYAGYAWASPVESAADYHALCALQAIFTEGKQARLFRATRTQQGVGYAVQRESALMLGGALSVGWVQTGGTPIPQSVLQAILNEPLTSEESRRAQALLRG
ncbi:MAG: insulinase family protein, partial [Fimbriimonadales bacterium]